MWNVECTVKLYHLSSSLVKGKIGPKISQTRTSALIIEIVVSVLNIGHVTLKNSCAIQTHPKSITGPPGGGNGEKWWNGEISRSFCTIHQIFFTIFHRFSPFLIMVFTNHSKLFVNSWNNFNVLPVVFMHIARPQKALFTFRDPRRALKKGIMGP